MSERFELDSIELNWSDAMITAPAWRYATVFDLNDLKKLTVMNDRPFLTTSNGLIVDKKKNQKIFGSTMNLFF